MRSEDSIQCNQCGALFQQDSGIPILIDGSNLINQHLKQIEYFSRETAKQAEYEVAGWQQSYLDRLNAVVPVDEGLTVLDIGTGSGYMALELASRGATVLACDLNLSALKRINEVAKKNRPKGELVLFACSAEWLPVKADKIDLIISNAVLEHLPDEARAVREIDRTANEQSACFVTVPLKLKHVWPFFWPINMIHDKRIGHLRRYDEASLAKLFGPAGFRIDKTFYTGHLVKVLGVVLQKVFRTNHYDSYLELIDRNRETSKYGASNIISILSRHVNA